MASRKDFLLRIAAAMSAGDIDHVSEWFTEDFKLHDPSFGGFRSGHVGARDMLRSLAEHVPNARIDALDMVEEGDKVAVRWLFSGRKDGSPVYCYATQRASRQGIGSLLVRKIEHTTRKHGPKTLDLHATVTAEPRIDGEIKENSRNSEGEDR
jgi:predicted ester cyclase